MNVLLIGTGSMAIAYAEVLLAQKTLFTTIGRGEASALIFFEKTNQKPFVGGLEKYLLENKIQPHTKAIIATGTETLMATLCQLIKANVTEILIEKPAALSINELLKNQKALQEFEQKIFVAYNRRFYSAVDHAKKLIDQDGGLQSMHFEFTEWAHKIEPLQKAEGVKENWFFANSTHVVDTAFFLAGKPKQWTAFSKSGELNWHPKTNFSGAGITENDVLFSYISNWESAGRWNIELLTKNRRIFLKPMEAVMTQNKGSLEIVNSDFDNQIDLTFKPGIYNQVKAFLTQNTEKLKSLAQHFDDASKIYSKIIN